MFRVLLKSKIHRAHVTDANLLYEGSLTIDQNLMDSADILEYERIDVYDITNGARLTTYAISGPRGSGTICANGAAAHRIHPGDLVIIVSYGQYDEREVEFHKPNIFLVDKKNRPV
ncbi:MAG: aspartate 1-decarboxylase [Pirellulales bacterium]|nr:aspartate 1-decarboxylase [Pirellulales bacterium]